jgi:hypothetical protein
MLIVVVVDVVIVDVVIVVGGVLDVIVVFVTPLKFPTLLAEWTAGLLRHQSLQPHLTEDYKSTKKLLDAEVSGTLTCAIS